MPENKGFYYKYNVSRIDGRDQPGGDREGATYFTLDLTFDPYALKALKTYADTCKDELPELTKDLYNRFNLDKVE